MFLLGLLVGAALFGGVVSAAELVVKPSTHKVNVNGKAVAMDAYNINGANYFKARDFAAAMDIGMWFKSDSNTVMIETDKKYDASYTGPQNPADNKTAAGAILFNHGGIVIKYGKISLAKVNEADGAGFMMTLELDVTNNSGKEVMVALADVSVNKVMKLAVGGVGGIPDGKQSVHRYTVSNLDGINVSSASDTAAIKEIAFKVAVMEDFKIIHTSDAITIRP